MGVKKKLVIVYFRVGLSFLLHVIFAIFLLVKVSSNDSGFPWGAVFSPIFCFDGVLTIYYIIYLASYIRERICRVPVGTSPLCFPGQFASIVPVIFYGIGIPLKLAAEIVLVLHLTQGSVVPFYAAGILLCLFFSVLTVGLAIDSLRPTFEWALDTCWS